MGSRRRIRRKACKGKVRHVNQTQAVKVMIQMQKRLGVDQSLRTYHCKFCNGWHVGNK